MAVLSALVLWAALVAGEPVTPGPNESSRANSTGSPAEVPAQPQRGWVQLTPMSFARPGPRITPDIAVFDTAVNFAYRWGLAAGTVFEPRPHLLLGATASLEQNIWVFDNDDPSYELCFADGCWGWRERGQGYVVRFGGDLRVGWTNRWVMAWALLSLQVAFSHMRLDCDNSVEEQCFRRETDVGPGLGAGLGVALRVTPGFAVGVESSFDHAWLDTRDDPFEAIRTWDLALVGVVRF